MQKTILYIDDDADDRDLLEEAILARDPSLQIVFAENGREAIQYLEAAKEGPSFPALVVLDLNMPLLDGRKFYTLMRNDLQLQHIPVIVFTSGQNPGDKNIFKSYGVEYVNKPFAYDEVQFFADHVVKYCKA